MSVYRINYTDITKPSIFVPDEALISNVVDITLIGKSTMEYGEIFDDNVLHILENFAAYENPFNPGNPDSSQVLSPLLQQPTEGQFWYNKGLKDLPPSRGRMYYWDSNEWVPFSERDEFSGNSGIIVHGKQLPLPSGVSDYTECSWFVSPQYIEGQSIYIECYTDANAMVYSRYRIVGSTTLINSMANYIILGVKNSKNNGIVFPLPSIPAIPSPTPTPTATNTVTPTLTMTSTVTPTSSPVIGASVTPTSTPTATPTATTTAAVTSTPAATHTRTPTPTPTITPSKHTFTTVFSASIISQSFGIVFSIGYATNYPGVSGIGGAIGNASPYSYAGNGIGGIVSASGYLNFELFNISSAGLPSDTVFSSISFVDNQGVLRTYNRSAAVITTAVVNGYNIKKWRWQSGTVSQQFLFTPNNNYILQIEV